MRAGDKENGRPLVADAACFSEAMTILSVDRFNLGVGHQWPGFLGWPVEGVETVASERNCFYGCKGIRRRKRPAIEAAE